MAVERIATIPVDGGRIAYRRLGSGRPLIVLNGLAATSADWDPSFIVAAGTEDIVIRPSNALALVNAISGAWLARFNGGGHAFMAQYPRPLANLINGFSPSDSLRKIGVDGRVPWIRAAYTGRDIVEAKKPPFSARTAVQMSKEMWINC